MAIKGHSAGGQRSKGARHLVGARVPVADAEKLFAVAEAQGCTVSDYVARLVHAHLVTIDIHEHRNQEALPIDLAS
ncbi:MAG: hypothetical protein JWP57_4487 [Spirosoma sp.]|nr:hypothetical protein [Spirosoma sp.]